MACASTAFSVRYAPLMSPLQNPHPYISLCRWFAFPTMTCEFSDSQSYELFAQTCVQNWRGYSISATTYFQQTYSLGNTALILKMEDLVIEKTVFVLSLLNARPINRIREQHLAFAADDFT